MIEEKKQSTKETKYPPIEKPKKGLFVKQKFKSKILNWLSIARQITLIDFDIFSQIEPKECFNLNWSKKGQNLAPNISSMKFNDSIYYHVGFPLKLLQFQI